MAAITITAFERFGSAVCAFVAITKQQSSVIRLLVKPPYAVQGRILKSGGLVLTVISLAVSISLLVGSTLLVPCRSSPQAFVIPVSFPRELSTTLTFC